MKKILLVLIPFLFVGSCCGYAQEVAAAPAQAGIADYWPYIAAALLAISEGLAISPLKANGIVHFLILIIKSIFGKK